jgi:hypothetical protein
MLGGPAALCLALLACGPSFEAIQEGDLRFAHCDRLDLDPHIAPSHRLHCWREWRRVYTYAQTRDRIEYAQRRIAEVVSGDTRPSFDLPSGVERPLPSTAAASAPSAGSNPPPKLEATALAEPISGQASGSAPPPPSTAQPDCRARCEAARESCSMGCETKPTGCQPCGPELDSCLLECGPPATGEASAPKP